MEAHGVRDFPAAGVRGRFVRRALAAAVLDHLLPVFAERVLRAALSGRPLTRDMAARACVYLQARSLYGIVEPDRLATLRAIWKSVLGDTDLVALEELLAREATNTVFRAPADVPTSRSAEPRWHRARSKFTCACGEAR